MISAIYKIQGLEDYVILLPDHTVAKATAKRLLAFLTKFNEAATNPDFKNGDLGKWQKDDPLINKPSSRNCAYITDTGELVVYDSEPFKQLVSEPTSSKQYLSTADYGKLHGRTSQQVKTLCNMGRIPSAIKVAGRWVIPEDAPYPQDGRLTAGGKYIGARHLSNI